MDEEKVFKRYDVRGQYPEELDEEFAERMGKALGTFVAENSGEKVVVCRDTKQSSETLKKKLVEGILSTGCDVNDAGIGPTDLCAYTGKRKNAYSAQVTSSHLPLEFNGFKFMYPEGNGFTNPDLNRLEELFRTGEFTSGEGSLEKLDNARESYITGIKDFIRELDLDFDMKVVVDTLGGATDPVILQLLNDLGAEVINIGDENVKGPYRDPPNPEPEYLGELKEKVEKEDADLGIASDLDGDRVQIYHDGFVNGDVLFATLAQLFDSDIVASIDSSRALEELIKGNENREVHYTRVGDPFVMSEAVKRGVELAGEPNGHYAFLDFVPYPSGTLAGILSAGVNLNELKSRVPDYFIEKKSVEVKNKEEKMEKIKEYIRDRYKVLSDRDGVKFKIGEQNVLLRPSGSSAKIRIKVESDDRVQAEETCWKMEKIIRNS